MAAAAPIALALSVAGNVMGGMEANNAARANAAVSEENARLTLLAGEQEAMQTRREERRMAGAMIAAMGGGGAEMGTGTAYDLVMESANQREMEIYGLRTKAAGEARNLMQKAADQRRAGRAALVGSLFSAASSAIGGIGDMRRQAKLDAQAGRERTSRAPRMSGG